MRILVSGYLVRRPIGGLAWHYLNYVIGLEQLGHDVYYIEDSGDQPSCFNPKALLRRESLTTNQQRSPHDYVQKDPTYGLAFTAKIYERLGLKDKWAYYDSHTSQWKGPANGTISDVIRTADLLLNVSNSLVMREWYLSIPARALIDTDPVFGQLRIKHVPVWRERALLHTSFLSFGENIGRTGCTIPTDGLSWTPTRQPVVLEHWPFYPGNTAAPLTTVMSWDSYPPARDGSRSYGLKSHSFQSYLTLPTTEGVPDLELAVECSPRIWSLLEEHKWKLKDATQVTSDPWSYGDYVRESKGEFTIAKEGYVSTRSGWFSERSAVYLASGRPVITQETGFSDWMDCEFGVLPFSSMEQAIEQLDNLSSDYARHCEGARAIAELYFDHRKIIPALLSAATQKHRPKIFHQRDEVLKTYQYLIQQVERLIPIDSSIVLIDDQWFGVEGQLEGRKCFPFLEKDGVYWGNPETDEIAISETERLKRTGVAYLILASPAFWWKEHYSNYLGYLDSHYSKVLEDRDLLIYRLTS